MTLRWDIGDACMYGDRRGHIRTIDLDRIYAAVEFDDDQHVTVDVLLAGLDIDWSGLP